MGACKASCVGAEALIASVRRAFRGANYCTPRSRARVQEFGNDFFQRCSVQFIGLQGKTKKIIATMSENDE